jgi:hypothetical protein
MRSISKIAALAGLSLLAAACTVNNTPAERPTTVVTPAPAVVTAPATTTYVTPAQRTTVVTPAY